MAAVCRGLDGAFTLVAVHADAPGVLVAARRNSPLVVGVGDGEMFVASDVAAFIAHTRDAIELGQDQLVVITPDGYEITSFTGGEVIYTQFTRRLGPVRRREGRLSTSSWTRRSPNSRRPSPTPCSGTSTASGIVLDELRLSDEDLRIDRQGLRGRLWHRLPLRADRQVRHRALVPDPGRGRGRQRVPLPGPGSRPGHAGRRGQPVRARPPTPWRRSGTPGGRAPGYWRSATPTARRSRGNPTRCSTRTPDRRSGWRRPRHSSPS